MRAFLRFLVSFAILSPAAAPAQVGGPVVFRGAQVIPLGAATVSVVADQLVVGNIGSSGADGICVDLGASQGDYVAWPAFTPLPGMAIQYDLVGSNGGLKTSILIGTLPGGEAQILPDFSELGVSSHRVEVWSGGEPIARAILPLGAALTGSGHPFFFDADVNGVITPFPDPFPLPAPSPYQPVPMVRFGFATGVQFSDATGPIGFGDELRAFPVNPTSGLGEIAGNDILISVPPTAAPYTMTFDDIAQRMFGRLHRGHGGAIISCDFDYKVGVALPAGVAAGVSYDMHRSETSKSIVQNLKFASAGDTDALSVIGELLTGGRAEVGRVSGVCDGASWTLTPDFSGSSSPDAHVQLFDAAGALVGEAPSMTGAFLVGSAALPTETGIDGAGDDWGLTLSFAYASPVPVTLPGAGPVTARWIAMHSNAPRRHRFFAIVDRTQLSTAGGNYGVYGEASGGGIQTSEGIFVFTGADGGSYLQFWRDGLAVGDFGVIDGGGVSFEPALPLDQFGVEWAPLGPPSATVEQTDWAFLSRLAENSAPVARMGIRMASNGTAVALHALPRETPKTDFGIVLRSGGAVVAQFVHSDETQPFATLPDWPIATGYQVLHYPDKTWSMWINLGYPMNVTIPGGPPVGATASAAAVVSADYIQIVFEDTPITSPVQESSLSMRSYDRSHRLFRNRKTRAVAVGGTPTRPGPVLHAPYPNPFNPSTTLAFELATPGEVTLKVYSVRGQYVATIHAGWMPAGPHTVGWNGVDHRGRRVASGVYVVELRAPDGASRAKLNLVK